MCLLALVFAFDATLAAMCRGLPLVGRWLAEKALVASTVTVIAEQLAQIGITDMYTPVHGFTPGEVLYSLLAVGVYTGQIPRHLVPADCAYGLMRLNTADIGALNHLTGVQRWMGEMRGEETLQESRDNGAGMFSLFGLAAYFPTKAISFRIIIDMSLIGAEPIVHDIPYFESLRGYEALEAVFDEFWELAGDGIGRTDAEIRGDKMAVLNGWVRGSPLFKNFPVAIQEKGLDTPYNLLPGTRSDVIERLDPLLRELGPPPALGERPKEWEPLTKAEVTRRYEIAVGKATTRLRNAVEWLCQVQYLRSNPFEGRWRRGGGADVCGREGRELQKEVEAAKETLAAVKAGTPPATGCCTPRRRRATASMRTALESSSSSAPAFVRGRRRVSTTTTPASVHGSARRSLASQTR